METIKKTIINKIEPLEENSFKKYSTLKPLTIPLPEKRDKITIGKTINPTRKTLLTLKTTIEEEYEIITITPLEKVKTTKAIIHKEEVLTTKKMEKTTEIRRRTIEIPKGLVKNNKTNAKITLNTTSKN